MAGETWDYVLAFTIVIGLILAVWARIGGQTIMELIRDIGEYFQEKKDNAIERATEI